MEQNNFNMKISAYEIDFKDAERFDDNTSVIFNCKVGYCLLNQKANNKNPIMNSYRIIVVLIIGLLLLAFWLSKQ